MTKKFTPKFNRDMVAPVLKSLKSLQSNQPIAFYELIQMCRQALPADGGFHFMNNDIADVLFAKFRLIMAANIPVKIRYVPSDIVKKVVLAFVTGRGMNITIQDLPPEQTAQATTTPDAIRNAE